MGGPVHRLLRRRGRVHRRHQAPGNAKALVNHLGHWRKAVGRARRIRHNRKRRVVLVVVDAHDEGGGVGGGRGDDDLLGARVEVRLRLGHGGEDSRGFDHVVHLPRAPGDLPRIHAAEGGHFLAIHTERPTVPAHLALEATVHRIVLEHVGHVFAVDEGVVDGDDLDIGAGEGHAEDEAADSAKAVDADADLVAGAGRGGRRHALGGHRVDGQPGHRGAGLGPRLRVARATAILLANGGPRLAERPGRGSRGAVDLRPAAHCTLQHDACARSSQKMKVSLSVVERLPSC
mmetsp:Transcript_6012/g.14640  ORF Transcript_6012/g.14640 Transcript_6012/m.14640 type:complete len:289 (+) Transcript_6012:519-1385(+)